MNTVKADISVVICAYSDLRWEQLGAAIASLRQQTVRPLEVVLVVDHNPVLERRIRDRWPEHVVVPSEETPGLSGARNTGVRVAKGSVVAFLDDDACAD